MSKSKQYWIDRMLCRDKAAKLSEDKLLKELYKVYSDSYIAIEKELNNFYIKYATENGLSYPQAIKTLKPIEIKQYASKLEELKKIYNTTKSEEVFLEMQRLGSRANVTRLQSLLDAIDIELIKSVQNTQVSLEQHLSSMYKRSYKQALEDIGASNKSINSRAVKEALSYPWSGRSFSERIWGNKASTMNVIKEVISKGIIQGQSIQKMAKNIMDKEKVSRYNAERLVRTETNFHMTKGHIDGYRESGVVKAVEVTVHYDERTCTDCESMDRAVVKLNEVSYGSNVPPFHPFCRCTVVPIVDNNEKAGYNYNEDVLSSKSWLDASFSSQKKFEQHLKHLKEYDDITPDDYLNIARELLSQPLSKDVEGFISSEGWLFKYRKSTNDFAMGHPKGTISTLFKPELGYEYWLEQIETFKTK